MNKSKLIAIVFCLVIIAGACKPKDEYSGPKMKELADQFFLLEDTVWINDAVFISPISTFEMIRTVKYRGFYFCIFREVQIYEHWVCKNRLLVIPDDGKEIVEVDLSYYDLKRDYIGDLYVLHDTLFITSYFCEQKGYFFDMELWKWQPVKQISDADWLKTEPVPTLFQFEGDVDTERWESKTYDTLFENAFLTDNQLYYVVNTKGNTYIAQLVGDKLNNVIDFGHRYDFFKWYGNGHNLAPNQCFLQFKENDNSYGVMEIQDKLIHIRHFILKQDTLPYIGTDNIEPLLNYLLNQFDHLTYAQVDKKEKSLQATCYGRFKELANDYFPAEYQTGKYKRINYYTVIDDKQMFTVSYCVNESNSMVKGAFFDWDKNPKSDISYNDYYELGIEKQKTEEVRRILTRLIGREPVKRVERSTYLLWEYRNITIKLYEDGRMVMYLTEK